MGRDLDRQKVIEVFKNNRHEPLNVNGALGILGLDNSYYEGMKKYVQRLHQEDVLERTRRGFYRYKGEKEELKKILHEEEFKVHYLHIWGHTKGTKKESTSGFGTRDKRDTERDKMRRLLGMEQSVLDYWQYEGNKMVYKTSWEGRKVEIKVAPPNRVEILLGASEDDLDGYMMWGYFNWLRGWISPIDWNAIEWDGCNIGINIDTGKITILDAKRITYQEFENELRAYYDKKILNKTRKEIHANNIKLPITELIQSLRGDAPLGVADLKDQVEILKKGISELSSRDKRLLALLDKLLIALSNINPQLAVVKYGKG